MWICKTARAPVLPEIFPGKQLEAAADQLVRENSETFQTCGSSIAGCNCDLVLPMLDNKRIQPMQHSFKKCALHIQTLDLDWSSRQRDKSSDGYSAHGQKFVHGAVPVRTASETTEVCA